MFFWLATCFPLPGSCMKRFFSCTPGLPFRGVQGVSLACFLLLGIWSSMGQVLPASGGIEWKPGIPGGIPARTVVFCNPTVSIPGTNRVAKGDGVTDDFIAIQTALNRCPPNQVVFLPVGTFRVTSTLTIGSPIVLRGAGMKLTRLLLDSTSANGVVNIGVAGYYAGPDMQYNITNGYTKGSSVLTLDFNLGGLADWIRPPIGSPIAVYQDNDPSLVDLNGCTWCGLYGAVMTQLTVITNYVGNMVFVDPPLYWNHIPSRKPRVNWLRAYLQGAGLENMTVETKNYNGAADSVTFQATKNCWARGVEVYHSAKSFFIFRDSVADEIRECYVHEPFNNAGGSGYGYHIFGVNSAHLIENNIAYQCRHSFVLEGGGSGCVIAYNYSKDAWSTVSPTFVYNDLITHGAHPFYNLYEGNHLHKWAEDRVHGSASHNTAFRNQMTAGLDSTTRKYDTGFWPLSIEPTNYYMNAVGNVLGFYQMITNTAAPNGLPWVYEGSDSSVFRLGYDGEGAIAISDSVANTATFRNGNYDYFTKSTVWAATSTDHTLPPSLYLTAKPGWWDTSAWPPFGPETAPLVGVLPAQRKFEEILSGVTPKQPSPPTFLRRIGG